MGEHERIPSRFSRHTRLRSTGKWRLAEATLSAHSRCYRTTAKNMTCEQLIDEIHRDNIGFTDLLKKRIADGYRLRLTIKQKRGLYILIWER